MLSLFYFILFYFVSRPESNLRLMEISSINYFQNLFTSNYVNELITVKKQQFKRLVLNFMIKLRIFYLQ